jgi:serpin B
MAPTSPPDPKPDERPDPGPPPVEWSADMQAIADGNNLFALDLYGRLRDSEKGNIFFSPYSIHAALGMTATGAKGQTRDEMVNVLHLPADQAKVLASGDLGRFYAHPRRDFELSVANALWGQKNFPWRSEWMAMQNARFGAAFNEADFAANHEAERQRINRWVEEQTRDRIKNLLQPQDIDDRTRMVLANAIYFKGKWSEKFMESMTRDEPFRLADGGTVSAPMMHRRSNYGYADADGVQVLEMPYQGGELSMVIVLPREANGLPAVEARLTNEFAGWLGKLVRPEVVVSLPRFKMEQRFLPNAQLMALGIRTAFDPDNADFSGMADDPALCISKVVHQSFVEVNEEGTEAAAATAVVMEQPVSAQVRPKPKIFRADHPFLLLIRDTKHGTILFMGRVMNPKE